MRGRAELRRVAPPLLWDGLLLPLDGHRFQVGPRSYLLGLRVLREEAGRAGRVPIGRDMPEDLAAVVRIIDMAADGRALAGDADLDGAPVCSYVTAYLRGRVIPSRGRRGVIFFWHWLRTPALSRRTGARVASWVLLGPWRRRARLSGAGARVNSAWHCGRQTGARGFGERTSNC